MQELEKTLEEIEKLHSKILHSKFACEVTEQEITALVNAKDIIRKHINGGWISVDNNPPKEGGTYIIKALEGDRIVVSFAKWQNRYKRFDLTGRRAYWRIIEWQPLPEP